MVKGYETIPLTPTQRQMVTKIHELTEQLEDEGFQNGEARALISLLHHLSEGYVLDPCYIIEKLGQLFPDYSWKVKSY